MKKEKWLNGDFKETEDMWGVCYIIREGEVELCAPYDTMYPILSFEEIQKLAEILEGDKQ